MVDRALDEFVEAFEIAVADLGLAIGDAIPDRFVALPDDDDDEDGGARVIKGAVVEYPGRAIGAAFDDFDWIMRRALRRLREALA